MTKIHVFNSSFPSCNEYFDKILYKKKISMLHVICINCF